MCLQYFSLPNILVNFCFDLYFVMLPYFVYKKNHNLTNMSYHVCTCTCICIYRYLVICVHASTSKYLQNHNYQMINSSDYYLYLITPTCILFFLSMFTVLMDWDQFLFMHLFCKCTNTIRAELALSPLSIYMYEAY